MIWSFSYTGSGVSASGTLDTSSTLNALNGYDIISITGQRNGDLITGIIPPSGTPNTLGDIIYDNIFFPNPPHFDYDGLFYSTLTDGDFNLYHYLGRDYELTQAQAADGSLGVPVTIISPSQVPEPASLAMFFTALLGLGLIRRRNNRTA